MATAAEILKKIEKDFGTGVATAGATKKDVVRLATGIFPLDLAMGGGFPKGKISIVYGPESSGKTNIVLKAIAIFQKTHDEKVVFVDAEHAFDAGWATILGVDVSPSKFILVQPHCAEQVIDIVEAFMHSVDVGLVAIDSIAAMVPNDELVKDADGTVIGGNSRQVGKMVRKALMAQSKSASMGRYPSLICINQIRYKVGVMHGDPETCPGGKVLPFHSSMTVRCYGKGIMDNKVSSAIPTFKETSTVIKKWKAPICAVNSVFQMVCVPHKGLKVGDVDDMNTVIHYAKNYGLLAKAEKGQGWLLGGSKDYKTLEEFKAHLKDNFEMASILRQELISLAISDATSGEGGSDVLD